jgi:hypothetical protein
VRPAACARQECTRCGGIDHTSVRHYRIVAGQRELEVPLPSRVESCEPKTVRERRNGVLALRIGLLAGVAVLTASACGGSSAPTGPTAPVEATHPAPASCSRGFELSLASDRGGKATPVAAANWFAANGGVADVPQGGWMQVEASGGQATLHSGRSTVHAVQGPDGTWQVDSGHNCG